MAHWWSQPHEGESLSVATQHLSSLEQRTCWRTLDRCDRVLKSGISAASFLVPEKRAWWLDFSLIVADFVIALGFLSFGLTAEAVSGLTSFLTRLISDIALNAESFS